jgi:hypothetical protein
VALAWANDEVSVARGTPSAELQAGAWGGNARGPVAFCACRGRFAIPNGGIRDICAATGKQTVLRPPSVCSVSRFTEEL